MKGVVTTTVAFVGTGVIWCRDGAGGVGVIGQEKEKANRLSNNKVNNAVSIRIILR